MEVVLPIERAVGDVRLLLQSTDGQALPLRVPYSVTHSNGSLVVEGKTALGGKEVECDLWYVNDGALFDIAVQVRTCHETLLSHTPVTAHLRVRPSDRPSLT